MHAESEARSVVDMVLALPAYLSKYGYSWNQQLFLSGYSQGGHGTMAAHQMLEADYPNIPVTASAPMAGPYDLSNTHRAQWKMIVCHIHSRLICPTLYFRYN